MILYEKIKNMPIEEMAEFLDKIVVDGIKCGQMSSCDICDLEECTILSYRAALSLEN